MASVPVELPATAASTIGRCESPSKDGVLSPTPSKDAVTSPTPSKKGTDPAAVLRPQSESLSMEPQTRMPIRAIPAYVALKSLGSVFRGHADGYRHAREVERIDCFWSYSRHASHFMNVCTLLVHYNAWQAFLAGGAVSVVTALMMPAQLVDNGYRAGVPCMATGLCTTLGVLFGWPSRQRVFLDRACIPQDDEEAKRNGILSLGYYLKMSKTVMVLWDVTYFRRLWCVFEFAAYLRLQVEKEEASGNALRVLPSMYGGMVAFCFIIGSLFMLVTRSLLVGADDTPGAPLDLSPAELVLRVASYSVVLLLVSFPFTPMFARHVSAFAEQDAQLRAFSLHNAECFCCTHGHRHPETKQVMACDRDLIRAAVIEWFGDVDTFDSFVRNHLHTHTIRKALIPYANLVVGLAPPLFWDLAGRFVWLFRTDQSFLAWSLLLNQMSLMLVFNPLLLTVVTRCFVTFCKPGVSHRRATVLSTLTAVLSHFLLFLTWWTVIQVLGVYGYIVLFPTFGMAVVLSQCLPDVMLSSRGAPPRVILSASPTSEQREPYELAPQSSTPWR